MSGSGFGFVGMVMHPRGVRRQTFMPFRVLALRAVLAQCHVLIGLVAPVGYLLCLLQEVLRRFGMAALHHGEAGLRFHEGLDRLTGCRGVKFEGIGTGLRQPRVEADEWPVPALHREYLLAQ